MKKLLFLIIPFSVITCTKRIDNNQTSNEVSCNNNVVYFKNNFVIQNKKLLKFIDLFIDRCKESKSIDSSDIDNNFYLLFIYQNDFFTRIKLSFMSPSNRFMRFASTGTSYFEYKGRVFIVVTGLDRLCPPDSSLQKELQVKYRDRIDNFEKQVKKDSYKRGYLLPFTWEADITGDTIFIRYGTINPFSPPPADTTELYKYIRSVKSFNRL